MSRRVAALLGGVTLALVPALAPLGAAEIPLRNPAFQAWDAAGKPEGWWMGPGDYRAVRDCESGLEGRCVLRVEGTANESAKFVPLGQQMGIDKVGGHLVKLSGMIRTEKVDDGWAGLWLRVDTAAKLSYRLENMFKYGPRGTTDWKRFEIAMPVVPNASKIVFGVLLSGSGKAWFDDLKLEVDTSVHVEKADLPDIVVPPRPVETAALADDAAMALPEADRPHVDEARRADLAERVQPIRSLFSDDFSDLQFLKPLLAGRRVVQLGESSHGVAEFNWLKVRLVKFLHQELGYDVVAFESSLSGCDVADARIGKAAPREVMRDCIFQVWHTAETLRLFEYLDAARKAGKRISLAGFDTQNSGAAAGEVAKRLVAMAARVDPGLSKRIEAFEAKKYGITAEEGAEMAGAYRTLAQRLAAERDRLVKDHPRPVEVDLAIQEARSRIRYVEQRVPIAVKGKASVRIRDEGMADNLDFVLDTMYPGRKVIVWAHNAHIARQQRYIDEPVMMGEFVHQRRGREIYTIGLYMGRGVAARNDRQRYPIPPPPPETLEAAMAAAGRRMAFLDLSSLRDSDPRWLFEPVVSRSWGTTREVIVPAQTYDGLIYIDTVTPPEYR